MITRAAETRLKSMPVYDSSALKIPLIHEFRELLVYRYLVWNLVMRDLRVRYKRSSIGFLWVMVNPLLTMGVLVVVFSEIFRFNVNHFASYLLAGTLLWNLYIQATNIAMTNFVVNGQILRKLYVPPSVFVVSSVGSSLVNFLFALGPFLLLSLITGVPLSFTWLFLVVPVCLTTMFTLGIALMVSTFKVFFSDTYEVYQVLSNVYYFLTPIFYPVSILPHTLRFLEYFNPMFLFIDMLRVVVIDGTLPSLGECVLGGAFALLVLIAGWFLFTRSEAKFVYYF